MYKQIAIQSYDIFSTIFCTQCEAGTCPCIAVVMIEYEQSILSDCIYRINYLLGLVSHHYTDIIIVFQNFQLTLD